MKIIYLILGLFLTSNSFSQNKMCGSDVLHHLKYNTDSIYKKQIDSIEASYLNYLQNKTTLRISEEMITIPVVVHVIHKGEAVGVGSNISDNQIISAINAMNDNFRNLNGAGVNMNFEFCLAKRDPSGNATNGINRVNGLSVANYSNGIDWSGACSSTYADESTIKNLSIWPNDKYYNIWVVHSICNGWAGYAYYPTTSTLDGTVIIASVMNASQPTLTHELGHGFNLMHTFEGSSSTTCPTNNDCLAEGDKVCDTPPHKQADCSNANPCTTSGVWDNSRYNYMSYCFYFPYRFTQGQKDRVRSAALVSPRLSLINSLGCLPPLNNDVGVEEILYPTSTNYVSTCTLPNVITPKVKIKNYGVNTITSLRIGCKLNNNAIVTQTWNGSLSSGNSTIINLSNIAVSAGSNSLKVITSLPNGVADPNITNDSLVSNFTQSDSLKISYIIKNKNCDSLGSIITSVSGGRSPYSFIWSNGNTSQSIFNLNEGSYTMTVKDNPNPNALPKFPECSPNTTNYCCNIGIYNVSLNTINKSSSVGGYENFDSIKTILFDNVSYTLNVTTSNSYSEYVSAWIDYNSNGTFEVLEQIMNNNINTLPSKIHTQTFTVPLNSLKNTPLRMRIASDLNTIANSCNNVTFGQHEDYTIFVNGYPFCSKSMNFQIVDTIEKYSSISSKICSGQSYTVCGQTYNATGTYVKVCTSATGCDSTVTLNLVVRPPLASVVNATICSGQSYTVCGQTYNATGTYVKVCTSSTGCDSTVTLNLVVRPPLASVVNATICSGQSYTVCGQMYNATGTYVKVCTSATGCDSTVTLNLVVRPPLASVVNATICSGQSYTVCGQMYNATGTYVKVCTSSTGCDSTVTLNLVVRPPLASVVNTTICSGQSYTVCGQTYNATGTYVKVCTSSTGCDSTVTLNLVVRPPLASVVNATICSGQSYTVCGQMYNATGTYVKVCTSSTGCDSTVTLNLVVRPPLASVVNATICSGQSYTVCGQMYNATGTYVKVCTSSTGCDSTVTLNLVVRPPLASVVNATICSGQSYAVCGQMYNATGTYVKVCTSSTGCDSTVTLNLVVRPPLASVVNATICSGQSYTVCGQTYNATGTYVKVCTSSTGCDSTVTLNLVVRPPLASVVNATICSGQSYTVCGQMYNATGTYVKVCTSATGCDSTVTLNLVVRPPLASVVNATICSGQSYTVCGQMYNATGTYVKVCTSSTGCDSTVTLNLVVRPPLASVVNATICSGQSYAVCGQMYNATGTYVKVCTSSTGCDSTVTLNLVVRPPLASVVNTTICSGQSYTVCGQMYNATGTYVKVCTSSTGCDSTVTLNLVVRPPLASVVNATICSGQSYTVCGQTYNATGTYVKVCTSATGCDSTVTLNLVVRPPLASALNQTICPSGSSSVCGQSYTTEGTYTRICTSSTGCDSTVTLILTLGNSINTNITKYICSGQSYAVCGQMYNATGTYVKVCTSSTGCDSTVTLNLVVRPPLASVVNATICSGQSYTVCGQMYNATGTYVKVCTSSTGCDSTVTLNLVVRPPLASVVNATICSGQSYAVCGQTYNATGTYVKVCTSSTGCDSTVTLNLVVRPPLASVLNQTICPSGSSSVCGQSYTTEGTYTRICTSSTGCDSTVTLILTLGNSINTNITKYICSGQSYAVCGQMYNATGTYVKVCTSSTGCDSTVTLNLVVRPPLASVLNQTICPSGSSSVCGQSYTTEGTYTRICTSSTGCDSTVTLILTLGNSINTNITKYICSGQSYAVCGQMYNATGTYVKVCTSSTGCDSTVTLNLIVRPPLASVVNATICSGQSYTVCGQMYNATGTYVKVCTSSTGCDSTVTLNLVVRPPLASVVNATICSGQSYTVCGQMYNATGTYVKVCTSSTGCDSTVTLNLVVRPPLASVVNATICSGQSYTVCGQMYNATGTYVKVCTSATGCDSTVTLNLVVRPPLASVVNATICSSQSYTVCGQTYNATGTYVKVCTSSTGCDSTVTLILTLGNSINTNITKYICSGQSYAVCGQMYNATGTYVKVCTSSTGCDSTVTLNLVVRPPLASVVNATICSGQSYTVCGQTYNATGTYVKVCTSSTGCDSTVTLNLVVRPPLASVVNATICSGQSYTVCGQMYNATGTYVKVCTSSTGCDSTVTLNLVVRPPLASVVNATICSGQSYTVCGQTYNATGTYVKVCTSSTGCDSTVTLVLSVINNEIIPNIISRNDTLFVENIISPQYYWYIDGIIADTTSTPFYYTLLRGTWSVKAAINDSCLSVMSNVISITTLKNNQINERILIYPNPNKGVFNLDIQSVNKIANRIKVCNFLGEVIFDKNVRDLNSDKIFSIELENPAQGIYILMLETDSNIIYSTFAIN